MKKDNMEIIELAKNFKLLSPAGSWDSLRAGVEAGANSVYFGITDFNMRAGASRNFTLEDLPEIAKYCKSKNVETCVTVNTLLYNSDLETMHNVITAVKNSGCDSVIVADISALLFANSLNLETCISTQLSVSNIETVKFFSKYTNRIVLARELTLKQVEEIIDQIKEQNITGPNGKLVDIEIFGHGALCVAVSGRCAMSLFCTNSSANKGKCAQICRRSYKVTDTETNQELVIDNNYVMSPKDLCTIGHIPQIIESGVKVLKIEGRGRAPEYVDTVIRCYREAIDSVINGTFSDEKVSDWNTRLKTVFNRGMSTGMYMGENFDQWAKSANNQATKNRFRLGKVKNYFSQKGVAEILVQDQITVNEGEECLIIGSTTGIVRTTFAKMQTEKGIVNSVSQKDIFTIEVPEKVRVNDIVYVFREQ